MKKLLIAALLAVGLAGCATIQNPVNTTRLATVESTYGVALSIAVAYRNLPLCKTGTTPSLQNICAKRSVIVRLQSADRDAQIALASARSFVKNNPTLSATSVIGIAQNAVAAFQAIEQNEGIH
jgi:ABC-type uncharacterized transport system substrate-binding protein